MKGPINPRGRKTAMPAPPAQSAHNVKALEKRAFIQGGPGSPPGPPMPSMGATGGNNLAAFKKK